MVYNDKTENKIVRRLFVKSEVSWGVSDFSKAIGPIIDLFLSAGLSVSTE